MKSWLKASTLAALVALAIALFSQPRTLDEQLLQLQLAQAVPAHIKDLSVEPVEVQALLLTYADDAVLLAKAQLALMRYPEIARAVLPVYGESSRFQQVLRNYGEDSLLPILYFMQNEIYTLELMRSVNETARAFADTFRSPEVEDHREESPMAGPLTPEERGRYAIEFLAEEGYGFIRQFVLSSKGEVDWVQTDRVLESLNRFFAGGIANVERKVRRDENITVGDVGGAALDVAVGVGAFKLLRMGRVAPAGRALTLSQRSAVVGAGLWRGTPLGARVAKYGAPAVLAYMALRYPSVLNSLLADLAGKLGVPAPVALWAGWTLILLPIFMVLRILLRPLGWVLVSLGRVMQAGRPRARVY